MVESEPAAGLVVIDGDPGVVAGLTSELEHRYARDYHVVGRLSARSGLAIMRRLDATGRPKSGTGLWPGSRHPVQRLGEVPGRLKVREFGKPLPARSPRTA